jgi:hypothetical protein
LIPKKRAAESFDGLNSFSAISRKFEAASKLIFDLRSDAVASSALNFIFEFVKVGKSRTGVQCAAVELTEPLKKNHQCLAGGGFRRMGLHPNR